MITDPGMMYDAPAAPGRGPELLAAAQTFLGLLDEVPGALRQLGQHQQSQMMSALLTLHGRSAQLATLQAAVAVDEGAVAGSNAASTGQWITQHLDQVPIEPKTIRAMASVADACRERKNHVITAALVDGSCSIESARTALNQANKVAPVIPAADRDEILGWFLQIDPTLGTDGLTKLTRAIIDRFDPDRLSKDDEKLEKTESLTWSTTATGMTKLVAELSPANAAILKEAINAKSAPRPAKPAKGGRVPGECSGAGVSRPGVSTGAAFGLGNDHGAHEAAASEKSAESARDERTPGKRRLHALMDLVGAGARTATGDGVQVGAATVLLTMGLQDLLSGRGATTSTGDLVDAGAARRFACTGDLIPAVLGGPSQPLDVGRRERLATKAIRAGAILRDGGCSFPGCDRPPGFCEVHHVQPWWTGGPTSLVNSALLCGRHHQVVHRQGYTAYVLADGVHWDLTPGLMQGHQTAAA